MPRMTKSETMALPDSVLKRNPQLGVPTREETAARADRLMEAAVQTACEQRLRLWGYEYLHLSYRAREKKGWPDLSFAVPVWFTSPNDGQIHCYGFDAAVELKSPTGSLSDEQKDVLARKWQHCGSAVAVIRHVDRLMDFRYAVQNFTYNPDDFECAFVRTYKVKP